MRRLVMWNLQTLDGYFEGKAPWDLGFHDAAWGDELEQFSLEQAEEVGTLLYGRATYEGMASHWTMATGPIADFMNDVPKVVFSRTLDAATWKNARLVRRDAADEVAELKRGRPADQILVGTVEALQHSLLFLRQIGDEFHAGNGDVSSSKRSSATSTPLTTMLRAMVCSWASSSAESSCPVKTTTGTSDSELSSRICSSTSKPDMSGSRRSSTTQSQGSLRRMRPAHPCPCRS